MVASAISSGTYNQLNHRLRCLYFKLGTVAPARATDFRPRVHNDRKLIAVYQDFRGGMSEHDIRQRLDELVYHIAHVKDPLKKRVASMRKQQEKVERFIDQHGPLQIVVDLANAAKHGTPLRNYRSEHQPQLGEVGRSLALRTGPTSGSSASLSVDLRTGSSHVVGTGGGRGQVEFWGDVVDRHGHRIGDVLEICREAVGAWERLMRELGI